MSTQELSLAEQETKSSARVVWVIAIALVVGFAALFTVAVFRVPKFTHESQMVQSTPPRTVEVPLFSDVPLRDAPKPATRSVAPKTRLTPTPDLMTVVPPKHKRSQEPLTPAELEFQRQLADFERKTP